MLNENKLTEILEANSYLEDYFSKISLEQKELITSELCDLEKDEVLNLSKDETQFLRELVGAYDYTLDMKDILKRERAKVRELYKHGDINSSEKYQLNKKIELIRRPNYFGNKVRYHLHNQEFKLEQEQIAMIKEATYETFEKLGISKVDVPSYVMAHTDDELTATFGDSSYNVLVNYDSLVFPKNRLKVRSVGVNAAGYQVDESRAIPCEVAENYIGNRTRNALFFNGYRKRFSTLGDLLYRSDEDLMKIRGFGDASLADLNNFKDLLKEKYPDTMTEIEVEKMKIKK